MRLTLTMVLFVFNLLTYGQHDFRDGYVVLNSGDTLHGRIDYKGAKANAVKCLFIDSNGDKVVFRPQNILGYRFDNGKFYISKNLSGENFSGHVFLEYLINGVVDVYYFRDEIRSHYYIENQEGDFLELKNDSREYERNGQTYLKESNEYIGLLKAVFSDTPELSSKIEYVQLDHRPLIKITKEYHEAVCDDACIIYDRKDPRAVNKFGIVLGLNQATWNMNASDQFNSFSPGVFYKLNMYHVNERLSFLYELRHYSFLNSIELKKGEYTYYDEFKNKALANSFLLEYEPPLEVIKPVLLIGAFCNWFYKSELNRVTEKIEGTRVTYESDTYKPIPFDLGLQAGVGLKLPFFNKKEAYINLTYQANPVIGKQRDPYDYYRNLAYNNVVINIGFGI